tara:strand:- start:120 stop:509 length:390 start_codon:yes stop_codon:yes gene_type:complete
MEKGKPTYFNLFLNEETYGDLIDGVFSKMEITKEQTGKSPRPFISNRKCQIAESITIPAGTDLDITLWLNERDSKRSASISIKLAEEYQGSGGGGYRKPSTNQGKSIGNDTSIFGQPPVRNDDDDGVPF